MPHVTTMPAGSRFFARLDRFECECPKCGQVLTPMTGTAHLPHYLKENRTRLRTVARHNPAHKHIRKLTWNPYTQRLHCPYCQSTFIAGLILWSVREGQWPPLTPPPDAVPDPRQMLQLRSMARGWWALDRRLRDQEANIAASCSCPDRGTSRTCSLHGFDAGVVRPPDPLSPEQIAQQLGMAPGPARGAKVPHE